MYANESNSGGWRTWGCFIFIDTGVLNTQKVGTEGTKPFPIFSHQKPEFGIYVFVKGVWLSAPN